MNHYFLPKDYFFPKWRLNLVFFGVKIVISISISSDFRKQDLTFRTAVNLATKKNNTTQTTIRDHRHQPTNINVDNFLNRNLIYLVLYTFYNKNINVFCTLQNPDKRSCRNGGLVTARVAKRAKVMFSQAVQLGGGGRRFDIKCIMGWVTWSGEVVLSWEDGAVLGGQDRTTHPQDRTTHPQDRTTLPQDSPALLGQDHPPGQNQPPPLYRNYGQCAGGTHPTGMQSCLWYIHTA